MNKEELLKENHGNYIVACYTIRKDGIACFSDLRGGEGEYFGGTMTFSVPTEIEYSGAPLTTGVFYKFEWYWEDSSIDKIKIDGPIKELDKREFLNAIFNAQRRTSGKIRAENINSQNNLIHEVTGSEHTYLYELLQNANDYPYNNEPVNVKFILTENYLFFFHSGACFNLRNVVGITSVNQGEKRKNKKAIGYKGIGFKTVFANNEYVYLKSGEWSFRFDQEYLVNKYAQKFAWTLMPIPTHEEDLNHEVIKTLRDYDMRVQFALRYKNNEKEIKNQLDKVFTDEQILLFIPNVYHVDIIHGNDTHVIKKDKDRWIVTDFEYSIPFELKEWVRINTEKTSKIPEKFKDIEIARISFAIRRNGKILYPVEDAKVYNYLPTELRLGLDFLVNADFIPNASRSGLHEDMQWNNHIMKQCGKQFAEWWLSFLRSEDEYEMSSVFEILPNFSNKDKYAKLFYDGFDEHIINIECIPTLRDGYYHLVKLEDVLHDKTGLMACDKPVLYEEEFYIFTQTPKCLPHPEIKNHKKLTCLINRYKEKLHIKDFSMNELILLSRRIEFKEWLTIKQNSIKFIDFLLTNEYIKNFFDYPIFLKEDGSLDRASAIYYNVDAYYDDLSFLSDELPRLNVEVRKHLESKYQDWINYKERFKTFKHDDFVRRVFNNMRKYKDRFVIKDNNIRFIHYLAKVKDDDAVLCDYPFFLNNGNIANGIENIYLKNELAVKLLSCSWIQQSWIQILDEDYYKNDKKIVKEYLSRKCKIIELHSFDFYNKILADNLRMRIIVKKIAQKETNVEFYRFLSSVDKLQNFTKEMRGCYTILTTDGHNEQYNPIGKPIFWQSDEWKKIAQATWMPKQCCIAISNIYFEGLSKKEIIDLKDFFEEMHIACDYSIQILIHKSLNFRIHEIIDKIKTKETSKEFLKFIYTNKNLFLKNGFMPQEFKEIPIWCKGVEQSFPLGKSKRNIYIPCIDLYDLYNQPWFEKTIIDICDDYYNDLFDSRERCKFVSELGLKLFNKMDYLRSHLFKQLENIKDNLKNRNNNISFHRYFAGIYKDLSANQLESIKRMPIFISSPNNAEGVLVDNSTNHYLPSALLEDIIAKDLVPIEIMKSVHQDYIKSVSDEEYFKGLENVSIDEDGFFDCLVKKEKHIKSYLHDKSRNIRFWRWVCDSRVDEKQKSLLSVFPILTRVDNNKLDSFAMPKNLLVSGLYTKDETVDQLIKEYVDNPLFVSPVYLEDGVERDWISLFKTLQVKIDFKDIVLDKVIPNLGKYKNTNIVEILATYVDDILSAYKNKKTFKNYFSNLLLLCIDGEYRKSEEVFISGSYFDIDVNPISEVLIKNLVSETYTTNCNYDSDKKRNIKRFFKLIANWFNVACDNETKLRNTKINYYIKNQDEYKNSESHYQIIAELVKECNDNPSSMKEVLGNTDLYVFTTTNDFTLSKGLYVSTAYTPKCQFMANGISQMQYISEKYTEYANDFHQFFKIIGLKEDFEEQHLNLLSNEQFSTYFWQDYAVSYRNELKDICTKKNLENLSCIPTTVGIKRPSDLYNTNNKGLKAMVLKLKNGEHKLPSVSLPDWFDWSCFRNKLYILDCLEYLKRDIPDRRKNVLEWIAKTPKDILSRYKENIASFIKEAQWPNGAKGKVALTDLYALEYGNKMLKDNFGSNPKICNMSSMPDDKDTYNGLCEIFSITILTNNNFKKEKIGAKKDVKAIEEISKRLSYLTYRNDKENWRRKYEEYHLQLLNSDIFVCEQIVYSYNRDISTDLMVYNEENNKLWYIDKWDGQFFVDVLNWIIRRFKLDESFDINFLRNLFSKSFISFIKKEEAGSLKKDYLNFLGLKEDDDFKEDNIDETNDYDENLADEENIFSGDGKEQENQYGFDKQNSSKNPYNQENYSHKERSNREYQREKTKDESKSERNYTRTDNSNHYQNSSRSSYSENSKSTSQEHYDDNRPLEERLKEKWRNEAQKNIKRPKNTIYDSDGSCMSENKSTKNDNLDESFFGNNKDYGSKTTSKAGKKIRENNTKAQNAAKETAEREEIFNLWQSKTEYTFEWFKYLMELQLAEKCKNERFVEIDFFDFNLLDNYTLHLLKPSKYIPLWIGDADAIDLSIDGVNKLKVRGFVKEIDEYGIHIEVTKDTDMSMFFGIKKIRFYAKVTTNIFDSLKTRFLQLGYEDDYNLEENLPTDIKFIYGPPGTGKTTRLVEILKSIVEESDEKINILVLTPTNKAADVIATKLVDCDECYAYLTRFGTTESKYLMEDAAILANRDNMNMDNFPKNIVVTTAARYSYDCIQPNDIAICDYDWDYIIIDEASMINLVTITYILHKAKSAKFIIAGDPKQIQSFDGENDIDVQNIYQMVELDSFKEATENYMRYPVEILNIQHRSVPAIGNLISQFSYNGMLLNDNNRSPQKPLDLSGLAICNINFIEFKIEEFDNVYQCTSVNKSALHLYSAIFTYNMVEYVVRQLTNKYATEKYSIGIICPYKAQADAIQQMIDKRSLDTNVCNVTSGTVHKFQGDECDIMFVVLNPPSKVSTGAHINNENILNVAMSRARDYLFLILPEGKVDGFNMKNRIDSIVDDNERTIMYCSDIEEVIFGKKNYIYENTNVTCHMPVNVYYDAFTKYEVRIDENAIDIQIND